MAATYRHLLSPGRIGTLALRNRILMCPMGDNQATADGYVTDQQIAYFEARARGGAALLIVGSVGITAPDGLSIDDGRLSSARRRPSGWAAAGVAVSRQRPAAAASRASSVG